MDAQSSISVPLPTILCLFYQNHINFFDKAIDTPGPLEGPGTRTHVRDHYRISFCYPVHLPRKTDNWYPNGSCNTIGPNRSAGTRASIHAIYYTLLLISESRSMQTLFATTHHETILSRSPNNLLRTVEGFYRDRE